VPKEKAAIEIIKAIERKKRIVYISRRWWIVAQIMKLLPYRIYRRIV
jgi:short-subunit dehydrogenase